MAYSNNFSGLGSQCGCRCSIIYPPCPCPPCPCPTTCQQSGELVQNGGMEAFTGTVPTKWTSTTPTLISPVTQQGRVHSGNSSVNLKDTAVLTQTISTISPGCFYEFSFFAHGEGAQVAFTATINFITSSGDVLGGSITVRQQDVPNSNRDFGYYRIITTIAAPNNAIGARIDFTVTAGQGQQSLDIDDVSFGTQ